MKKLIILIILLQISLVGISQIIYKSDYIEFKVKPINGKCDEVRIERKNRNIIIGDELISIERFMITDSTQYFKVVKIEVENNLNKTYYTVTCNNGELPDFKTVIIQKINNFLILTISTHTQTIEIKFNLKQ